MVINQRRTVRSSVARVLSCDTRENASASSVLYLFGTHCLIQIGHIPRVLFPKIVHIYSTFWTSYQRIESNRKVLGYRRHRESAAGRKLPRSLHRDEA